VRKYGFNIINRTPKEVEKVVRWCKMMKRLHPWYDEINLMMWAYEKGVTDKKPKGKR